MVNTLSFMAANEIEESEKPLAEEDLSFVNMLGNIAVDQHN